MDIPVEQIKCSGLFREIDIHLSDFLSVKGGEGSPLFRCLVMLLSARNGMGDICLPLPEIAERPLYITAGWEEDCTGGIVLPSIEEIVSSLKRSGAVGDSESTLPLILDDGNRLYFHKNFTFEQMLAEDIIRTGSSRPGTDDAALNRGSFESLFPGMDSSTDWQAVAALSAMSGGVTVISGGPGTGKTSTVVRILALLAGKGMTDGEPPLIALTAPTGKAAARLRDSVNSSVSSLPVGNDVRVVIPSETFTIHRLLGHVSGSHGFIHNRENPLPHDILVVDECSMADLPLMCRLLQAVKPGASLILLGDRDQLASVEGGAVFGDICGDSEGYFTHEFVSMAAECGIVTDDIRVDPVENGAMKNSLVILRRSYRFSSDSGIGLFAEMVRRGDADRALEVLDDPLYQDIILCGGDEIDGIYTSMAEEIISYDYESLYRKIFALTEQLAILTAVRNGKYGTGAMNSLAERILYRLGVIDPADRFYPGRPVMVSRNDYSIGLFNGDIGVVPEGEGDEIIFTLPDGGVRSIDPSRMPAHETAFALTVHKSQGSEFDGIVAVMPDRWNRVMTRELLYTAVTRARRSVVLAADREILREMINTPTKRMSGLKERLWGSI